MTGTVRPPFGLPEIVRGGPTDRPRTPGWRSGQMLAGSPQEPARASWRACTRPTRAGSPWEPARASWRACTRPTRACLPWT